MSGRVVSLRTTSSRNSLSAKVIRTSLTGSMPELVGAAAGVALSGAAGRAPCEREAEREDGCCGHGDRAKAP